MKHSVILILVIAGTAMSMPVERDAEQHHRVRRGSIGGVGYGTGYGTAKGNVVVDGISVWAASTGNNNFVQSYQASQNFLATAGNWNYVGQQGGLQAAGWAGAGAANAGFNYDHIATGKSLPSNVAGYNGFPSYG